MMHSISDQDSETLLGVVHEDEFMRHFRCLIYTSCFIVTCLIGLLIYLTLYL